VEKINKKTYKRKCKRVSSGCAFAFSIIFLNLETILTSLLKFFFLTLNSK
jgi:hypothetical protein